METLASKTMLKRALGYPRVILLGIYRGFIGSETGSVQSRLYGTYSEAMLISGASKQISCAIFYIFDLIIY